MLSSEEYVQWCARLSLSPEAQAVVSTIRSAGPTRRVGGGRENVSGRYPSRKMGVTIQFESHRSNSHSFMRWSTTPTCWSTTIRRRRSCSITNRLTRGAWR